MSVPAPAGLSTIRATSTTPAASASSSTSRAGGRTRRRAGAAGADQPAAPRRLRLRGQHRRRRRHPDSDAGPFPAQGDGAARHRAAAGRPVRRRPRLPAARRRRAATAAAADRARRRPRKASAVLGWRDVPTDDRALGASARAREPVIEQVFIADGSDRSATDSGGPGRRARFERKLYVIRKRVEHAVDQPADSPSARRSTSPACRRRRSSTRAC